MNDSNHRSKNVVIVGNANGNASGGFIRPNFSKSFQSKPRNMNGSDRKRWKMVGPKYECAKCSISGSTGSKFVVMEHFVRHHVTNEQAPWSCSLCGFRANSKQSLASHQNTGMHRMAERRNPKAVTNYVRSSNPYVIKFGEDIRPLGEGQNNSATDSEREMGAKRKSVEQGPRRKKIRGSGRSWNVEYDNQGEYNLPVYDDINGEGHMYDSQQDSRFMNNNGPDEFQNNLYLQRQILAARQLNARRFLEMYDKNFGDVNRMERELGFDSRDRTQGVDYQSCSSWNNIRESPMGFNFSNDNFDEGHRQDNRSMLRDCMQRSLNRFERPSMQRTDDNAPRSNERDDRRVVSRKSTETVSRQPDSSEVSESSADVKPTDVKKEKADRSSNKVSAESTRVQSLEKAAASSSTAVETKANKPSSPKRRASSDSTSKNPNDPRQAAPTKVRRNSKKENQSAEVGSSCKDKDVKHTEKHSEPDKVKRVEKRVESIEKRVECSKKRVECSKKHVENAERVEKIIQSPMTVLPDEDHCAEDSEDVQDECLEDEEEYTDGQILEDKISDLIGALEPLKNISKALIALDHHMRRILPMVEQITKDSLMNKSSK